MNNRDVVTIPDLSNHHVVASPALFWHWIGIGFVIVGALDWRWVGHRRGIGLALQGIGIGMGGALRLLW